MPPRPTRAQCVAVMHRARPPLLLRALLATACAAPGSLGGAKVELPISSSPSPYSSISPYARLAVHSHGRHGQLSCRSAAAAASTALPILHSSWPCQRIPHTSPHLSGSSPGWLRFRS
jgi:hypothetical protein